MSLMINVQDDLARRLQAVAEKQSVPVEQVALAILDKAVPAIEGDKDWSPRNQRRLELIRKSNRGDLTKQEQIELDQLQSWLDEQFESFDEGLLQQLDDMKQHVAQFTAEKSNG